MVLVAIRSALVPNTMVETKTSASVPLTCGTKAILVRHTLAFFPTTASQMTRGG